MITRRLHTMTKRRISNHKSQGEKIPQTFNQITMETIEALLNDLQFLLRTKYPTKKAIAEAMAIKLNKNIENYYGNFIRYTTAPTIISNRFVQDFYKVFQGDLDAKEMDDIVKSLILSGSLAGHIEALKKNNENLSINLERIVESNKAMILLVEAQTQLIAELGKRK